MEDFGIHLSASGYGLYWAIMEYLRTQDNYRGDLRALRGITRQLKSRLDKALRILNDYGLFVVEGNAFYSPLLMEKMQPLEQKRAQRQSFPKPENVKQNESSPFQTSCNTLGINTSLDKVKESKEKESITSSSKEEENDVVDDIAPTSMTLAWERYVDELANVQQWIEIMAMRSGLGLTFVKRFPEVLQHFKRHIQAVGNEKDIQSPGDAKRYFCFYNTPGSKPFRQLVEELHKPIDKMKRDLFTKQFPVPTMYDISGSAAFFNKADFGIAIERDRTKEVTRVHVQKVKTRKWKKVHKNSF